MDFRRVTTVAHWYLSIHSLIHTLDGKCKSNQRLEKCSNQEMILHNLNVFGCSYKLHTIRIGAISFSSILSLKSTIATFDFSWLALTASCGWLAGWFADFMQCIKLARFMPAHSTTTPFISPNRIPNLLCVTDLMWMCLLCHIPLHHVHIFIQLYVHKRNWRVFWFLSIQFTCFKAFLMHANDGKHRHISFEFGLVRSWICLLFMNWWLLSVYAFVRCVCVCVIWIKIQNVLIWCFKFVFCLHFRASRACLIRVSMLTTNCDQCVRVCVCLWT